MLDRARGCLLGGAIGDALGYPVEFVRTPDIPAEVPAAIEPLISDDTQMTMFVAEGILRPGPYLDEAVAALLRWYETQGSGGPRGDGLLAIPELHARRAPGTTNMAACAALARGARPRILSPGNDSKGCGAVMRAAPWGIACASRGEAFVRARDTSVLTHGHPSGYLSAAHLAATVWGLVRGEGLPDALAEADAILAGEPGADDLIAILARATAIKAPPSPAQIEQLGGGWTGDEALAIAIACALTRDDVAATLWRAARHSGDSDSTAAICGNLLGALLGLDALPAAWVARVELRDVIDDLATQLAKIG